MRFALIFPLVLCAGVANAADDLSAAIQNTRAACGGIGAGLSDMKTMAGINTAVTGVGTVAGGVALGTGIAKAGVDAEIEELERQIQKLSDSGKDVPVVQVEIDKKQMDEGYNASLEATKNQTSEKLVEQQGIKEQKSKELGNWRTGALATSAATDIAGAVIAGTNRVRGDLKSQINECLQSVKTLSAVRMQARISNTVTESALMRAEDIVRACENWATVNIDAINSKATGATVSAGVGAGLGLVGTITSASANSKSVREGDAAHEKNLNTASNVLAGGTTLASGVATVFNATQIGAIKRAATVADECEEALRQ